MYKTIVVHVDDGPQLASRLAVAAWLAREHEGHLVGSAVTGISERDFLVLGTSPMAALPDGEFELLRERAGATLQGFAEKVQRLGVDSWEQRLVEDDAEHALLLESRYADLIVLSRGVAARSRFRLGTDLPEYVVLHSTRPVLLVPENYGHEAVGRSIVVGWNGSMEATRAITAALPLLRRAASVLVAVIDHDDVYDRHGEQPGADLALYLARHGVKVDVVRERSDAGAGPALLGIAKDANADLVVAGAYGHSRYREWVAGGVTRALLDGISVPLLMAH